MKIRIQRTDATISFREEWYDEETGEVLKQDLRKVHKDFFELAERFFDAFPRFKEIVFNTKTTQ